MRLIFLMLSILLFCLIMPFKLEAHGSGLNGGSFGPSNGGTFPTGGSGPGTTEPQCNLTVCPKGFLEIPDPQDCPENYTRINSRCCCFGEVKIRPCGYYTATACSWVNFVGGGGECRAVPQSTFVPDPTCEGDGACKNENRTAKFCKESPPGSHNCVLEDTQNGCVPEGGVQ